MSAFLVVISYSTAAFAATAPSTVWEQTYSAAGKQVSIHSAWQTSDGGYILGGLDYNSGADTMASCLIKTDAGGNKQWEKLYESNLVYSVVQTSDGGYVFVADYGGANQAYMVKTDAAGNKQWSYLIPGDNRSLFYSVKQSSDGNYVATGFDSGYLILYKIDANGNKMWSQYWGDDSGEGDYGYCVWPTSDGGYIIGGGIWSETDHGMRLVKTDGSGNLQWNKTYDSSGVGTDEGFAVQQTRDGGYIFVGQDGHVLKLDANGNQQWAQTIDIGGNLFAVQQTWDGGYITAGNGDNITVVKLDNTGTEQWRKVLESASDTYHMDWAGSIQQIGIGNFILGWTSGAYGTDDFGVFYNLSSDMVCVPNSQLVSDSIPATMEANKSYQASITYSNIGTKPWTFQDNTTLGMVLGTDASKFGTWTNQTIPVAAIIRPGQSYTFTVTLTAPAENGTYNPQYQMVWENHNMFGAVDNKTVRVVNGTGPENGTVTATAHAQPTSAVTSAAAQPSSTATQQATVAPTAAATTGKKGGLPCLSSLMLPLLAIGAVAVSMTMRKKRGGN